MFPVHTVVIEQGLSNQTVGRFTACPCAWLFSVSSPAEAAGFGIRQRYDDHSLLSGLQTFPVPWMGQGGCGWS